MRKLDATVRILVVDDDPAVRLTATELLRAAGYEVSAAESGEEGIGYFDSDQPALVLLDIMLPGISGYEVCEVIRRRSGGGDVPILVMTGLDDKASIDEAYRRGATDFVTKPVVWDLLPHRIGYALRAHRVLSDLRNKEALEASAQRIAQLGSWVWHPDTQRIERSAEYFRIFDIAPQDLDQSPYAVLRYVDPADRDKLRDMLDGAIVGGQAYRIDFQAVRMGGETRRIFEQVEVLRDASGEVRQVQGITQDITERVKAETRIRLLAYYDSLTGLPNRTLFREVMSHALQQAERNEHLCAVLLVDLDRFSRINESFGHAGGDFVLRTVAERIVACLRSSDLKGVSRSDQPEPSVARLGGDEFTLLLFDVASPGQVAQIARRVRDVIIPPIDFTGSQLNVSASIGVALYPTDATDPAQLIEHAETAMFAAKSGGHDGVRFYNRAMSLVVQSKLELERDLRRAIEQREFRLHYQAKVDAARNAIVGAEALIRWRHPTRGLVAPGEFIPVAEECGLIVPITDWVVREACRQIADWQSAGLSVVPVSVNLSGVSFRQHGLMETLLDALAESGIEPSLLQCEVTESVLMQDVDRSVLTLNVIKQMGIGLAVDDFGTGYSSLTYLKRFPVDTLKVDRSFIAEVASKTDDAAIAGAIIAMGQNLRLQVVAEGVETPDQARFLLARGCNVSQGYLFSQPVCAEEFAEQLRNGLAVSAELLA